MENNYESQDPVLNVALKDGTRLDITIYKGNQLHFKLPYNNGSIDFFINPKIEKERTIYDYINDFRKSFTLDTLLESLIGEM